MPSRQHKWLVLWLARRMTADGLIVSRYDGPTPQGGLWNALPAPFALDHFKPDLCALDHAMRFAAVGEAKTQSDVCNAHTHAQLSLFARLKTHGMRCQLYIAVPETATLRLDRALAAAGLVGAPNIVRLHIPDVLLKESRLAVC